MNAATELLAAHTLAADAYDLTGGRLAASCAALLALIGIFVGVVALWRSRGAGRARGRRGGGVAIGAGVVGTMLGAAVALTADGGLGTGNGLGGAVVGVVLGLISIAIGAACLGRARRAEARGAS